MSGPHSKSHLGGSASRVIGRGNGIGELDVVALVRFTWRPLRATVDGDDQLGSQCRDGLRDLGAQRGGIADVAVGEVPELHVADADDGSRAPLCAFPQRASLLGRHAFDAHLTARCQCVVHGLPRRGPLGDRRREPVLGIVGMRHQDQRRSPVGRKWLQRARSGITPCTTIAVVWSTHVIVEFRPGCQQQAQQRCAADDLDEPVGVDVGVHLAALDGMRQPRPGRPRTGRRSGSSRGR